MKKISFTLFAAMLFIAATLTAFAQADQTRQVSGYTGIASSGSFSVHIKIDGTESLKITGNEKIISDIETTVKDGTLHIGFKNSWTWHRNNGQIDVYVTAKSLSALSNSGSGSIKLDGDLTGDVNVHESGSGSITASVKSDKINAHISGSGSVKLMGGSNDAIFEITGSGGLNGGDLKTNTANVHISGSGSAHIYTDKSLTAHISGSGSLRYKGNATNVNVSSSGSGRVTKEKGEAE